MNALRTILPALFLSLGCIAAPATLFHDDFSGFTDGLPSGWKKYETGKAGTITPAAKRRSASPSPIRPKASG